MKIFLKSITAIILTLVTYQSCASTSQIFSSKSFWYTPIPDDVELHPNSALFVNEFLRQKNKYYGNVTINMYKYSSPVYIANEVTSTVKVTQWDCQNKGKLDALLANQWAAVPIPKNAVPADGNDGEMSVYDPKTDSLWEFWKTRKNGGQWEACWGGRISNAHSSSGIFDKYYGTTATGLPFIGGQITAEELKSGTINHVIGIALVDLEKFSILSWPALRSDGYNPNNEPNRIPEGLRFRLDPNVNVDALKMHPAGKIIAKAAQRYGFVVWDKAGSISLRSQNPYTYTTQNLPDPYEEIFNGTKPYDILKGFPWEKLQFLPMDYGKQ